jgi:hypothetical protein
MTRDNISDNTATFAEPATTPADTVPLRNKAVLCATAVRRTGAQNAHVHTHTCTLSLDHAICSLGVSSDVATKLDTDAGEAAAARTAVACSAWRSQ